MDDDDRLIGRTLDGEGRAFGLLVERYSNQVFALALRLAGDRHRAEELTQETFLRAYAGLAGFDRSRPWRPWLMAVALNTARSALRLAAREPAGAAPGDWPNPAPGPEDQAAGEQRRRCLDRAVGQLPDKLREAVALRYFADLSFDETAEALGVSQSAAKMRVYRALEQLRALLDKAQ